MTSVSLLVIGSVEEGALGASLHRVFPAADFITRPRIDGFTSSPLPRVPSLDQKVRYVDAVAKRLVAEAFPGRQGKAPDLVIAVDDLELANIDQPEVVVRHLTSAVRSHVERNFQGSARDRAYAALRERCSFHLLCPMVEAYFFGEPAALQRAGAVRASSFSSEATDVEAFGVDEPAFLEPPDVADKFDWRRPDRARHPKRYLKYLTDEAMDGGWTYREMHGGIRALGTLAWGDVLKNADWTCFARSLFEDIAHALGQCSPFPGRVARVTWAPGRDGILRNV